MHIKHIFLALALSMSLGLFAQHNEEVTIEGTYRPKVNKVDKILMKAETPQQSFTMPETEVKVLDIERRSHLNLDKLTPLNYREGKGAGGEGSKNFLMAGFGTRISPVFLYKHNSNLTKYLGLGVGIKHYSSWLGIKDYGPSSFMNNAFDIGLSSSRYKNTQLGGNVYYNNDMYHYYGYHTIMPTDKDLGGEELDRQTYNTVGTHFGLSSTSTRNGEFVHDLGLDYHYLFGKMGGGIEHYAGLNYDLGYVESWWGKKNYPQKLGVVLGAQYGNNEFVGQTGDSRLLFMVNPYFEMKDDFYRLHFGVRMDGAKKSESTGKLLSVHPDVKGSLFVLDNTLEFYAGLNGGRKMFTYSDFISENPFVGTNLNMETTTVKLGFDGGLRTNLMKTMDVHLGVRYRHIDNDPFYSQLLSEFRPYNSFNVIYDETRTVSVLGNIRWLALDKLTVDAGIAYHKCNPVTLEHAWYRPTTEGSLKLDYQISDAFAMNASFLYQGGRWAHVKLQNVYDLGLGADYKVQDQLTIFFKADNLLNQKYQLYLDYPVTGIEFFAGLKMSF